MESTSARQLASMMFSLTPTVFHRSLPSELSIVTRTRAPVASLAFITRTLKSMSWTSLSWYI